jgi:hypothetical protein
MAIQLSPEQEQVVGQAIHAGLIRIPDDVVGVGIETIRQRLEAQRGRMVPRAPRLDSQPLYNHACTAG